MTRSPYGKLLHCVAHHGFRGPAKLNTRELAPRRHQLFPEGEEPPNGRCGLDSRYLHRTTREARQSRSVHGPVVRGRLVPA